MGILSYIVDTVLEYGASQGEPHSVSYIKQRDKYRELKKQRKEQKRRKKKSYGYQNPDDEIIDWAVSAMNINEHERP